MTSESSFHGAQQMDNFCPKNDCFVESICLWDTMRHFNVGMILDVPWVVGTLGCAVWLRASPLESLSRRKLRGSFNLVLIQILKLAKGTELGILKVSF